MKALPPFALSRWGIYFATAIAALSAWLGLSAGGSLDFVLLRSVFVFVVFTVIALAGEALVSSPSAPGEERGRGRHDGERGDGE